MFIFSVKKVLVLENFSILWVRNYIPAKYPAFRVGQVKWNRSLKIGQCYKLAKSKSTLIKTAVSFLTTDDLVLKALPRFSEATNHIQITDSAFKHVRWGSSFVWRYIPVIREERDLLHPYQSALDSRHSPCFNSYVREKKTKIDSKLSPCLVMSGKNRRILIANILPA